MKPYTRSIVELFDGKKRYLIPLYQRQYAWRTSPDLELLWEDIERAFVRLTTDRASLTPHFMGAIVVAQIKTYGKQVQAFEIIDGQQRLTTFQLLLTALRDVARKNGSSYADEVQKYLINDGVMEQPEIECYKLWPSMMDRRSFITLIDPTADAESIAPNPLDDNGIVRRSIAAHSFFHEKIEALASTDGKFDDHRLEKLFEALKEGLAIVSIELEGGDDPQTIFETLNSRGVELSAGDLMRNFIFQRAKGMGITDGSLNIDALYHKHWLPLDRSFWAITAPRGRQTQKRLEWMLTDHLSMKLADNISIDRLFEGYRRWILTNRPFDNVSDELIAITSTANIERRIFEQKNGDELGEFGKFADAFEVSTAMPLVIYLATEADVGEKLKTALEMLMSYILRRDICGYTTKNYNKLFVGIIDRLRKADGSKIDALSDYLLTRQSEIDRWPNDAEWQNAWIGRDQYKASRQPRLRYIFALIEMSKRTSLNEETSIKSDLSIEHIMPKQWRDNWKIADNVEDISSDFDLSFIMREKERDDCINRIGNLTLLTQPLNSKISNGPFSVKMPALRSYSSLTLNRELNAYDQWDEKKVSERGLELFGVARKIWRRTAATAPAASIA
jgi:Protein of unknown function DUF262/Protein of unknown function (DUF1524)